jgi:hypothetical protein
MMSPHTFRPGVLSTADAEALNRLLRAGRGLTDIQVRPPLSIIRGAFDSQPIIFLVPEVTPESGSGSGDTSGSGSGTTRPTLTVVTDICLSPGGDGGFIRKAIIDPVTGEILDEFCESIPACGSGEDGGLCDDLPPPSGSGSGSGEPGVIISGCAHEFPARIFGTWGVNPPPVDCHTGSFPLDWNGTAWVGTFTGCTGVLTATLTPAAFSGGTAIWTLGMVRTGYTYTAPPAGVNCGILSTSVGSIFVSGADSGNVSITFTE